MGSSVDDPIVSVLPIHLSTALHPAVHIHQFPLLTRPLQVPPSAANAGKPVHARLKPKTSRIEIHVPVDTRPEVWNRERSEALGEARAKDDLEKNSDENGDDGCLTEVRLRSELLPPKGAYMLGIVRHGRLHLHPISQTHQLRPSLTYIDAYHSKTRKTRTDANDGSESDEGPPPDPDDPNAMAVAKKEAKPSGESRDVTVSVRKVEEKGVQSVAGGLTAIRREMLQQMREEDEEPWEAFQYCDGETDEAAEAFEAVFSRSEDKLVCQSDLAAFLKSISGL